MRVLSADEERDARKTRTGGRSARVVRSVLDAAIAELGECGYAKLSVEAVALRAGVNKTTVYRRWPTKAALVRQAMLDITDRSMVVPDTGTVRQDLIETLKMYGALMGSPLGRSVLIAFQAAATDPEVAEIGRSLREDRESLIDKVIRRAVQRGELPPGTDAKLVGIALSGGVRQLVLVRNESARPAFLGKLVDLVLDGARAR